jgi:outer membrane protein
MKNLFLIAACLTLFTGLVNAQQAAPPAQPVNFSLADCISYAYEHQTTVKNATLDVTSADYKVKETTGIGLPQINGSASLQDYIKIPTTLIPAEVFGGAAGTFIPLKFGVKYQSSVGLDVNQIIFSGSYLVGLKASRTYKELSLRSLTRTKIQTNIAVTKAYYQVLVSNEQIRLLDANITQLKQQLDETTAQNKQGFVELIDVQRLEVQYNNLVTNRENTLRMLGLGYETLKFQMGMPIENQLTLKDKLENIKLDQNVAENAVDTSFYRKRIEFNLSETNKALNELDLKRQKSQFLPSLSANGNLTSTYQNDAFSELYKTNFPSSYIGLSLKVPIFNGFQRRYQVKESEITVLQSQNSLNDLKNSINLEAKTANVNYVNGIQSLNNQKRNQGLAVEVLRVSKIKYQQGVGSSIEVTQAQTELETADNQYIQALYDALINKVNLDQAYGRIN